MDKVEIMQHAQVIFSVHIVTRRLSIHAQIKGHNSIVAWGGEVRGGVVD